MQVAQKGCVITWDFDILKGDVTFTLLRCRRHTSIALPIHEHHMSGAVGGIGSVQYVDRHWTVGVDISVVEPPLVCHDGDSIQVSRVLVLLLGPSRGAEYCDQFVYSLCVCMFVCLSTSMSLEPLDRSSQNFVCSSPVAVARSSSGGVAIRYVLPVLWMMSHLAVMGAMPKRGSCTVQRWP